MLIDYARYNYSEKTNDEAGKKVAEVQHDFLSAILKQLVILNAPDKEAQREWYSCNAQMKESEWFVELREKMIKKPGLEEVTKFLYEGEIAKQEKYQSECYQKMADLVKNKGVTSDQGMFEGIPTIWYENSTADEER